MSLWSMNDGSALSHNITTNGSATVTSAGTSFITDGIRSGDIIVTAGGEVLRVLSVDANNSLTLTSAASGSESGVSATLRKPPTDGKVDVPDTTVFGVSEAEGVAGSDNINSIALTSTTGARYVQAPTITVAGPTARTITQANIDETTDIFTATAHGMATGTKLTYTSNGTNIVHSGGTLADATAVFVIKLTDDTFKIASSLSNANSGTALDITNDGNDTNSFVGDTATATATVSGGAVSAITVTGVGSDYQSDPTVTVEVPKMTIPTSAVNAGTDVITFAGHGLADTDQITYNQVGGGTLMSNVTDGQTVFVRDKTDNTFKIAATSGGTAIDIGTGHSAQTFTIVTNATQATATANRGTGGPAANTASGFHVGWVKRTVGTGGRAGRVQYETLVAASSISGDFEDIAFVEDA